ncbi:MAG: DUF3108 domain-containing protein [Gemmatimonadaceae bacterium]|nr:DUF3108 domain-containing protein [Gemmatimonadaceae bacterium]
MLRRALATLALLVPVESRAQAIGAPPAASSVPFQVGERLAYEVRFGKLRVGEGVMELIDSESIRGRDTWHTRFRIRGGVPFYRVDDVLESWIDKAEFHSLRFVQDLEEGGRLRERRYEFFPDRKVFRENDGEEEPSVEQPLDDGSFLYFVRTLPLEVGATYTFDRYFRPDRNPVVVKVLGRERVKVPAGTFETLVLQPVIKSKGVFSERGEARVWISDDPRRIMVQMKTKTKIGSLNLYLTSVRLTTAPTG